MRRAKLINVAAVTVALLFLVIMGLQVRARFVQDVITRCGRSGRLVRVHIKRNGVVITLIEPWPVQQALSWRTARSGAPGYAIPVMFDAKTMVSRHWLPGVNYDTGTGTVDDPTLPNASVSGKMFVIVWPLPLLVTLALAGPLGFVAMRRTVMRGRRRAQGRCVECGYDMRASPGRCPECGHVDDVREEKTAG